MRADPAVPLTAAQRGMWLLAQLRPDDGAYHTPCAVDIDGPLDVPALAGALTSVVGRHPALRARFRRYGDDVVQVLAPLAAVPLPTIDLSIVDDAATGADREATEFVALPFDLACGPLFRARLLRLAERSHRLLLDAHHAVFDGVSRDVVLDEVIKRYAGIVLTPPPAYNTYVTRRAGRERAGAENAARSWADRLAGLPATLELPMDRRRSACGHRAVRRTRTVAPAVTARLDALARRYRVTRFMVLAAACDVLVHGYGPVDVPLGVALSGRDTLDSAGLVGFLAQPVVLRADLSDDPGFLDLLAAVRDDVLDAHARPHLPFDAVLAALGMPRDPWHHPVYQVMFAYSQQPAVRWAREATFTVSDLPLPAAKVDLALTVTAAGDGLRVDLDYRAELFDPATVEDMLARYAALLDQVGGSPDARVSALLVAASAGGAQPARHPDPSTAPTGAALQTAALSPAGLPPTTLSPVTGTTGDLEQAIGAVWTAILGRRVDRDANFFDAGGTSMLLIRLCEELRTELARDVRLVDAFRHPSIRAMAAMLAEEGTAPDRHPETDQRPATGPLPGDAGGTVADALARARTRRSRFADHRPGAA
jgi:hypothetical protein